MAEKKQYSLDGFQMRSTTRAVRAVRPSQLQPITEYPKPIQNRKITAGPRSAHPLTKNSTQNTTIIGTGTNNRKRRLRPMKTYGLVVAAFAMIAIGVFLSVQGFRGNQQVAVQARVLAESAPDDDRPADNGNYDETDPPKDLSTYKVAADLPRLLSIPDVGVLGRVKRVGVDANNTVQAPKNVFDIGWYEGSAKPGESGAIFLDGHVSGPTKGGIFWNLKKIDIGDTITLERGDGKKIRYKVAAKELFDVDKVDMAKALRPYDPSKQGLNIMTCNGKFDAKTQTYDKRLVVYAVAE